MRSIKISIILVTLLSGVFILTCSTERRKTAIVINFDVEDYITPVSEGIDEIPKWIAGIMSEEGVTGTFYVIGEKARSLEKRGRADVIKAMAKHDIGSHTNRGSIHPTVTEQLEKARWDEGFNQMLEQESAGIEDLQRIFGVPITTLARHGGSYGPQLINALGHLNAGYTGSPIHLPGRDVVWYCNTLNFHGQIGGFDNTFYRDDLFDPLLDSLRIWFPRRIRNHEVLSVFTCHPCKVRTEQFWDLNFYYGANPDSSAWKIPDLRPMESMMTAQKNFRRLMQFFKGRKDIEITTFRKLMTRYDNQKAAITKDALHEVAGKTVDTEGFVIHDDFSPVEIFAGLVKSIGQYRNDHFLPGKIRRTAPLGPMEWPITEPEISTISMDQVYRLAQEAETYIATYGWLPAHLKVNDHAIGTGSFFDLLCSVYLDMSAGRLAAEYSVRKFDPYPKWNEQAIIQEIEGYKSWPVHRRDLDMSRIVEFTKLQFWTLKPAHSQ